MINKKGKSEPVLLNVSLKDKDMPVWKVNEQLIDNHIHTITTTRKILILKMIYLS